MARVQMLHQVSGGRGDNTAWPERLGFLDCDDDEAHGLVRGGLARWAHDEPHAEPDATGEPSGGDSEGGDVPGPESGSQDDDSPGDPARPRIRDPKETWEQHAVIVHGVDVNDARSMTKADLIDKYGNPPA